MELPLCVRPVGALDMTTTALGRDAYRGTVAGLVVSGPSSSGGKTVRNVGSPTENPDAIALG